MQSPPYPTLVVGDQSRRLITATVVMTDTRPGHEVVELTASGPDGQAHLVGSLVDVLTLIWQLDVRLSKLARGGTS